MSDLLMTLVWVGGALVALHLTFMFKSENYVGAKAGDELCACGHAAAFHKDGGGCRHAHDGSVDCYGYCTCQRRFSEVSGAEAKSVA